jgi:hypothetical protein
MANVNDTAPAKHKFRIIMSEVRTWDTVVEAKDRDEACDVADAVPDRDWNIGMSDFEIVEVQRLTKECACGAVMDWDDLNECWDCETCHTARV